MVKNLFTFNFKKIPIAFIVSVLMLIVIHVLVSYSSDFWHFSYLNAKWGHDDPLRFEAILRNMPSDEGKKRVFLLGSSQTRTDFDEVLLNKLYGDKGYVFYNLGLAGSAQPIDIFMMRKRILKYNPDLIIYMPFVETFYSSYKLSGHNQLKFFFEPSIIPYLFKYLNKKEFISCFDDIAEGFLGKISILFRYRNQINSMIGNGFKSLLKREHKVEPEGHPFLEVKGMDHFIEEMEKYPDGKFNVSQYTKLNQVLFSKMADDIASRNVKLIVISGPTHSLIEKLYDKETIDPLYNQFLEAQARKHDFMYFPENRLPAFQNEDFYDFSHLTDLGRDRLMAFTIQMFQFAIIQNQYPRYN